MKNYHDLLSHVLAHGAKRNDRTGTGTLSVFDARLEFDLSKGFPLLTTKKTHWGSIIAELCMFINAESNISYLHQYGCTIWDEWADNDGNLGAIYGVQWRKWLGFLENDYTFKVDQLKTVVQSLKSDPHGRRHLVSAWNVGELPEMALPPCHYAFQFYVRDNEFANVLDLKVHMRSVDLFLGLPFNIASYAALQHLIARVCNYDVGRLIMDLGDCHIYLNHIEQVNELLSRDPDKYPLPELELQPPYTIEIGKITPYQFVLKNYQSYPSIKAPIAV